MADHCGATDPLAKAEVVALTNGLEAGNLRRENERLKAYIRTLERRADAQAVPPQIAAPPADGGPLLQDYALTCKALATLLTTLNDFLILDESGAILDMSRRPSDRVVVDAKTAEAFVRWWKANSE